MKKFLLPALLLASATCAEAKEVVVFEEDFNWIEDFIGPAVIDNIAENDATTSTPGYNGLQNAEGTYLRNALFLRKSKEGEVERYWCESIGETGLVYGANRVYAGRCFLKFGKTAVKANFRFQPDEAAPEDAAVKLEFDWCPWRNNEGVIDPVQLQVEISEDGKKAYEIAEVLEPHGWEVNHKLEWIHENVDLEGFIITRDTRIRITLVPQYWNGDAGTVNRYCLDNIKMSYNDEEGNGEDPVLPDDGSTVYFSDDFEWLQPWVAANELGDPVGTNDALAKGISINGEGENDRLGKDGRNVFETMMDPSLVADDKYKREGNGYKTRIYPSSSAYYTFIAHNGYLRCGSDNHNGGLRTPEVNVPADETELYLEFDWCPAFNADGSFHETELLVQTRPGDVVQIDNFAHNFQKGDTPKWNHVCIDLFENENTTVGEKFNCMIQNVTSQCVAGEFNYFIDNIRISNKKLETSGVSEVVVEEDSNAPVEFYNLQGVRVYNPENGLYIRRQGNRVSKCYVK